MKNKEIYLAHLENSEMCVSNCNEKNEELTQVYYLFV